MPNPTVEFELDNSLPLQIRNTALDFTDRWHGFEGEVFRIILKLTRTPWRHSKIRFKLHFAALEEPAMAEMRGTVLLLVGETWSPKDYLEATARELITLNTREKVKRQAKTPLDSAAAALLAEAYSKHLISQLLLGSPPDIRHPVAHFLSAHLPAKYPSVVRENLLSKAPSVRTLVEEVVSENPLDSGRFYDAYLQLLTRLREELDPILSTNL